MKTSAINGFPEYEDADALAYGAQMKALVDAIDPRVIARFASLSAATSAYGAFTAAGGVMTDGMMRAVASDPQIYHANQWRGMVHTSASQATFFSTTISDGSEVGVATLNIPDPGWPYILDVSAVVIVAAQAGVQCNVRVRLDTVSGTIVSQDGLRSPNQPAGDLVPIPLAASPTGTLTGAHSLVCTARRVLGSGNWSIPSSGSLLNSIVRPSYA